FLVDGVDVNDNLFGTANNLFVEDAIEETQVLTSGISAEYGRFSGGVVNAVTKSGGDIFSGSYRLSLNNDDWTERTPFEKDRDIKRNDKVNKYHEGTFGGPILKSRLWFFASGRYVKDESQVTLPQSGALFDNLREEKRGELKLTGTVAQNHTFYGSYFNTSVDQTNTTFSFTIDPRVKQVRQLPNDRWVVGYRGVLSSRLFAEARWSQKEFGFRNSGGTGTDIVADSPFITLTQALGHYNALYFDGNDPEDRNNWQVAGSLSYFLTTPSFGSHDIKAGVEIYNSRRTGGNSQSPTGYVFDADFLADASGLPIYDAQGRFQPVFVPGESLLENWIATRGAKVDIKTTSFYIQDGWRATRNLSFDLGVRYESVRGEATGDIITVDTDTWVPRLAATYDIKGDGRFVAQATYAWYAGKYSESQFANNTDVGNPSLLYAYYDGPAGVGMNFAPGFDPSNYVVFYGSFPTQNVVFESGLSSPVSKEFTASLGAQIGRGYIKGTFVQRTMENFVEDFISMAVPPTDVIDPATGDYYGTFSTQVYRNSDEPQRDYQGLQFIGRYPFTDRWSINGNYTYQIKNEGNFEGEGTNTPGVSSLIGNYPEVYDPQRHYPVGRLNDFQAHKLRLWTIYNLGLGRLGTADFSLLYRYDSALTYSLAATGVPQTSIQLARLAAAGYPDDPGSQTIYFADRGTEEYNGYGLVDFGLTYQVPVFKTLRPYLKFDMFNIFNDDTLATFNTTVLRNSAGPVDSLGLPTTYTKGSLFGQATSAANHVRPRTWQVSLGFRF
ncbi:MAG: TonB-dependent receptor, partial [Vicinamibacteraceae bacterium]|nr:TonB-dependent receptor [Vicinamibacteraceae bacterium]